MKKMKRKFSPLVVFATFALLLDVYKWARVQRKMGRHGPMATAVPTSLHSAFTADGHRDIETLLPLRYCNTNNTVTPLTECKHYKNKRTNTSIERKAHFWTCLMKNAGGLPIHKSTIMANLVQGLRSSLLSGSVVHRGQVGGLSHLTHVRYSDKTWFSYCVTANNCR